MQDAVGNFTRTRCPISSTWDSIQFIVPDHNASHNVHYIIVMTFNFLLLLKERELEKEIDTIKSKVYVCRCTI